MKKLPVLLLSLLPCLAAAQVELLGEGQPVPFRAVMGHFTNDTLPIAYYDSETNMVYPGWAVERVFYCLQSTDEGLTKMGDRYIVARAFLTEAGDPMRQPFAYCEKRAGIQAENWWNSSPLKFTPN